ncbi:E3 ubiquitin-protein ligase TRIM39-like [Erpetoichthys calabaricus]|uniref:E3 ubiquitin-protein ligase TRIM39-like n=1 Tax=Erpetoichthys calabaricus TaxID=27687 RepID=UPI0022345E39|nr:E3 ubiquitin-protein ligase TRIM39-like [Erpetoichthys calabaricus]
MAAWLDVVCIISVGALVVFSNKKGVFNIKGQSNNGLVITWILSTLPLAVLLHCLREHKKEHEKSKEKNTNLKRECDEQRSQNENLIKETAKLNAQNDKLHEEKTTLKRELNELEQEFDLLGVVPEKVWKTIRQMEATMMTSIEKKFIFIFLVQFMTDSTVAAPIPLTISSKQNDTVGMFNLMLRFCYIVVAVLLMYCAKRKKIISKLYTCCRNARRVRKMRCFIEPHLWSSFWNSILRMQVFSLKQEKLTEEQQGLIEEIKYSRQQLDSAIIENQNLNKEIKDLRQQLDSAIIENQNLNKEIKDLRQQLDSAIIENQNLNKEIKDLRQQLDSAIIENQNLNKEIKDLRQQLDSAIIENQNLNKDNTSLEKKKLEEELTLYRKEFENKGFLPEKVWRKMQEMELDIFLDHDSAHPDVSVDADALQVRFVGNTRGPDRWYCVTMAEGLRTRNHYWEVEVGEKSSWAIGVVTREIKHMKIIPETPGDGFWVIRLCRGKKFQAVSKTVTELQEKPKKVGVYLKENYLCFYNAENTKHIYTFPMKNSEPLFPVFSPGSSDRGPLIIKKSKFSNTA